MVRNIPPSRDVAKRETIVERWMNKTFTHTPSGKDDVTKRDTSEDGTKCTTPANRGTNIQHLASKTFRYKCNMTRRIKQKRVKKAQTFVIFRAESVIYR